MDTRPVFVLVTAVTCGACIGFKQRVWKSGDKSGYRETILKNSKIRLVEIEMPSVSAPLDTSQYPQSLRKWARWYPTIMLFTGSSWNQANPQGKKGTITAELSGVIFNGDFVNGQAVMRQGPLNQATIDNWLNQNLNTNPIFNSKISVAIPGSNLGNPTAPPPIPYVVKPAVQQPNQSNRNLNSANVVLTNNGQPLNQSMMVPTIGQIAFQDREIDSSYER